MPMKRPRRWVPIQAVLLGMPLAAIALWVILGGYLRAHGPSPAPAGRAAVGGSGPLESGVSRSTVRDGEVRDEHPADRDSGPVADADSRPRLGEPSGGADHPGKPARGPESMGEDDARPSPQAAPGLPTQEVPSAETSEPFRLSGLPPPGEDYPADRLEDRVDGAADWLRGLGCTRLVVWRLTDPPADLELLVFAHARGASQALARDAGPGRDREPGDEASVGEQAILFRRGAVYARLLADPEATAEPARLLELAQRIDRALEEAARGSGEGRAGGPGSPRPAAARAFTPVAARGAAA